MHEPSETSRNAESPWRAARCAASRAPSISFARRPAPAIGFVNPRTALILPLPLGPSPPCSRSHGGQEQRWPLLSGTRDGHQHLVAVVRPVRLLEVLADAADIAASRWRWRGPRACSPPTRSANSLDPHRPWLRPGVPGVSPGPMLEHLGFDFAGSVLPPSEMARRPAAQVDGARGPAARDVRPPAEGPRSAHAPWRRSRSSQTRASAGRPRASQRLGAVGRDLRRVRRESSSVARRRGDERCGERRRTAACRLERPLRRPRARARLRPRRTSTPTLCPGIARSSRPRVRGSMSANVRTEPGTSGPRIGPALAARHVVGRAHPIGRERGGCRDRAPSDDNHVDRRRAMRLAVPRRRCAGRWTSVVDGAVHPPPVAADRAASACPTADLRRPCLARRRAVPAPRPRPPRAGAREAAGSGSREEVLHQPGVGPRVRVDARDRDPVAREHPFPASIRSAQGIGPGRCPSSRGPRRRSTRSDVAPDTYRPRAMQRVVHRGLPRPSRAP